MACSCGGNRFVARQVCRHDVVVDDSNMFMEKCGHGDQDIYDAEEPYGPYTCLECEKSWDALPHYKVHRMKDVEMQLTFHDKTWDTMFVCVPESMFQKIEQSSKTVFEEAARITDMLINETTRLLSSGDGCEDIASIQVYHIPEEWEESVLPGGEPCIL